MPPCSSTGTSGVSSAVPGMGVPAVRSGASVSLPSSAEPAPATLVWGRGSASSSLPQPHRPPGGSPAEGAACPQPRDPRGTGSAPRQLPWAPAAPRPSQPLCVGETKAQPVRRPEPRQEAFCLLGGAGGAGQTRHGVCRGGWAVSKSPPSVGQPPNPPGVTAAPGQPQPCATGPWFAAGGDGTGHGDGLSGAGGSPLPPQDGARGRTPLQQGASTGNGEFQGDLAPVLGREGSRQPVHLPRPQTVARGARHCHHLPCGGENGSPPRSSSRRNPIRTRPHPQGGVGLPPAPQPP